MTRKFLLSGFGALLLLFGGIASADPIDQFESCVNVDGAIYNVGDWGCFDGGAAAGSVTDGIGADGLGMVTIILSGAGAHFVDMYVDWEIDEAINTWFNEFGTTSGTLAAGQSWEIDEPGYLDPFGDIYFNFLDSDLDNSNGVPSGSDNDVSLALGWDFTLAAGETATIEFLLADLAPASGFWLQHTDPNSDYSFFFSSTIDITDGVTPVPEPGTLWLLGAGLLGLGLSRRRNLADS